MVQVPVATQWWFRPTPVRRFANDVCDLNRVNPLVDPFSNAHAGRGGVNAAQGGTRPGRFERSI